MDDATEMGVLDPAKAREAENKEAGLTCPISAQLFHTPVELTCNQGKKGRGHVFEKEQILKWALLNRKAGCPTCRAPIHSFISRPDIKAKVNAFVVAGENSEVYVPASEGSDAPKSAGQVPRVYQPRTESKVFWFFVSLRALIILAGLAVGIYLSILVVPAIIELLIAAGIAPVFAWSMGVIASLAIIYGVTAASALEFFFFHILWKPYICLKAGRIDLVFIHALLILGGLGCGIYASIGAAPLFIGSLATLGIPAGLAAFLAIAFTFIFVHLAIEYLALCLGEIPGWRQAYATFSVLDSYHKWPWLLGLCAGLGLGIYLVVLLSPLLTNYFAAIALGEFIVAALYIAIALLTAKLGSIVMAYPVALAELAWFAFMQYRTEAYLSSNAVLSPEQRTRNVVAVELCKNAKFNTVMRMLTMIDTVFLGLCEIWGMNRALVLPPLPGNGPAGIPEVPLDAVPAEVIREEFPARTSVAEFRDGLVVTPLLNAAPAASSANG